MRPSRERTRFILVAIVAVIFTAALIIAPMVLPFNPNATELTLTFRAPGEDGFILGSDSVGRDVLMRTLFGGSESVVMAFAIVAIAFALGTAIGLAAGLAGGAVD